MTQPSEPTSPPDVQPNPEPPVEAPTRERPWTPGGKPSEWEPEPGTADDPIQTGPLFGRGVLMAAVERTAMKPEVAEFRPGDSVRVHVRVVEGARSRIQVFAGVVIARHGVGVREAFTVRKVSFGVGVERIFPLHSPVVDDIVVTSRGRVRRAKLYYLRGLRGKSAKIRELRPKS